MYELRRLIGKTVTSSASQAQVSVPSFARFGRKLVIPLIRLGNVGLFRDCTDTSGLEHVQHTQHPQKHSSQPRVQQALSKHMLRHRTDKALDMSALLNICIQLTIAQKSHNWYLLALCSVCSAVVTGRAIVVSSTAVTCMLMMVMLLHRKNAVLQTATQHTSP